MAWHVADTESRYYLAMMGIPPQPGATELVAEMVQSHDHVVNTLPRLAIDRVMQRADEVWTTRKVCFVGWHGTNGGKSTQSRAISRERDARFVDVAKRPY